MDACSRPVTLGTALSFTFSSQTDPEKTIKSLQDLVKLIHGQDKVVEAVHLNVTPCFHMGVLVGEAGTNMMQQLGQLTNLKTLIIKGPFRAPFPLSALSSLISETTGLVQCSLNQMTLVGSPTDFEAFGHLVLARHIDTLQVFDIDMIYPILRLPGSPPAERPILNPLLKTLAQCQQLKVLMLGGCHPRSLLGTLTFEAMEPLFRSGTINRLSLVNLPICFHQLCSIAGLVETNRFLKHLCITSGSMAGDNTVCRKVPPQGDSPQALEKEGKASLASMIKRNQSLVKLILFIPGLDQDEDLCAEIFEALEESSLKAVYLGNLDNASKRCNDALIHMVRKNYVLEEFGSVSDNHANHQHYPCSVDATMEMSMLLRLNRDANRGKLLQDNLATRTDWVESLSSVGDDLDCIFHLLSLNPALCESKDGSTQSRRGKRRREGISTRPTAQKRTRLYRAAKYTRRTSYC